MVEKREEAFKEAGMRNSINLIQIQQDCSSGNMLSFEFAAQQTCKSAEGNSSSLLQHRKHLDVRFRRWGQPSANFELEQRAKVRDSSTSWKPR